MHLARVTGAVVSTQKSPSLVGKKLLLVRRVSAMESFPTRLLPEMRLPSIPSALAWVNWFYSAAAPAPDMFFPARTRPSIWPLSAS
ncbi:propanediol utilization: polyhedral bodies [Citrobacter koseri]|uniref:Propanediol utilization: polyhedral bodies n=1 Tax=Citrobacter koseri TaxID=545 RepID=A0A2X2VVE4_CITKO|nr:propanediol utilization: polyhedral bodies [Citrobacter koseri]